MSGRGYHVLTASLSTLIQLIHTETKNLRRPGETTVSAKRTGPRELRELAALAALAWTYRSQERRERKRAGLRRPLVVGRNDRFSEAPSSGGTARRSGWLAPPGCFIGIKLV